MHACMMILGSVHVSDPSPPHHDDADTQHTQAITSVRVLEYIRALEIPVNRYAYVYYQDVLQAALRMAFELKTHIPQVGSCIELVSYR